MKPKLFIILIIIQIFIIFLLSFQIYQKQKNILGETAVNSIKKENLIFPKEGELKYFYEPRPNIKYNWHGTFYYINNYGLHGLKDCSIKKYYNNLFLTALVEKRCIDNFMFFVLSSN